MNKKSKLHSNRFGPMNEESKNKISTPNNGRPKLCKTYSFLTLTSEKEYSLTVFLE